jgi:hypothetical protein
MRTTKLLVIVTLIAPISFASEPASDSALEQLASWMTGSFSSEAQSQDDDEFHHITLHMARIWDSRTDGVWLYVEQASASAPDRPYRQRVYHVRRVGEDVFASSVYTFDDPLERAGAWRKESPLEDLSPSDLEARDGCTIYLLQRADGAFEGSTLGRLCTSKLRGSTWASSEVVIGPNGLTSWDRGWDDTGTQVWGAEKAGYRFDRK